MRMLKACRRRRSLLAAVCLHGCNLAGGGLGGCAAAHASAMSERAYKHTVLAAAPQGMAPQAETAAEAVAMA